MYISISERLLTTLWVGALWSIGYIAVPILFATLEDRMVAGMLAGKMFVALNYLGLVCGSLLLLGRLYANRWNLDWTVAILVVMLFLVGILTFWLQPLMAELKSQGLLFGSQQAAQFGRLHGVSSTLYLMLSLGGLALVVFLTETNKK